MKIKLSPAQQIVVERLQSNPKAYIRATPYWDWQYLECLNESGKIDHENTFYFKRRTREVLVGLGILTEFAPDKYILSNG